MKKLYIITLLGLTACADIGTQFTQMSEPNNGERARMRVTANMLVKGIPDSSCINWSKPGAGTIFGGIVGSSGYRGRSLGMPNPNNIALGRHSGEFYLTANQPFTVVLLNTPDSRQKCQIGLTFTPEPQHDYDLLMQTADKDLTHSICSAIIYDITNNQNIPVKAQKAQKCQ
ncbi:hypothetical protein [Suttonella ornithocola]|uniref:Uncharacterized protein n=1 Tax=Suttonella ornithocola TaxID=279832 RepID=A0A380MWW7_9GAMM|nr:hypothetical protein [Suttonella ornithocola]SUO97075.1 Uncharacterised protein [Suttonella ornithocola]